MCRKWFGLEQKLVPFRSAAAFGVRRDAGSPLLVSLLLSHCQERTGGDARDLLPLLQPAAPQLPPPARPPACQPACAPLTRLPGVTSRTPSHPHLPSFTENRRGGRRSEALPRAQGVKSLHAAVAGVQNYAGKFTMK